MSQEASKAYFEAPSSTFDVAGVSMSLEENKAIAQEIWNQKRLELIEETFAQHLN